VRLLLRREHSFGDNGVKAVRGHPSLRQQIRESGVWTASVASGNVLTLRDWHGSGRAPDPGFSSTGRGRTRAAFELTRGGSRSSRNTDSIFELAKGLGTLGRAPDDGDVLEAKGSAWIGIERGVSCGRGPVNSASSALFVRWVATGATRDSRQSGTARLQPKGGEECPTRSRGSSVHPRHRWRREPICYTGCRRNRHGRRR